MIKSRITLKQLEAFVFVVDTGTFRAAAAALGTTQPNISTRIATLEAALNVTLLTRDAGAVRLTANGEKILSKTRDVLWAGEALIEEAGRQDLIEETLRLGVTELVACTWLQDFLRRFKVAYPKIRVQLEVDVSTSIDVRLMEGQLDLALQTEPFKSTAFETETLGLEPYCWVANADLIERVGSVSTVSEFFDYNIMTHAKHTQACAELRDFAGDRSLRVDQIVHSSALSACVPMALEGMGIAMLPERLVAQEVASGTLHKIEADWLPSPLSFVARYAPSRAALYVKTAAQIAVTSMRSH